MKRRKEGFLCCLMFFAISLLGGDVFAGHDTGRPMYGRGDLPKRISVVKADTPPIIDGVMDPGEWENAAVITGLIQVPSIRQYGVSGVRTGTPGEVINMASDQSYFYVTYDDDNLYIAHHSPPPARVGDSPAVIAVMLKQTQTIHDANLDLDDSIHIAIIDPEYPGGDKYVLQVNSLGTTFECIWYREGYTWEKELIDKGLGNVPGITLGWDPKVTSASTLTLDGWVIELAVPWDDLGPHIRRPEDGEVKYMNFGRIWKEVMNEAHAWKAHDEQSPAGEVVFMGDEGIVVRLNDAGNLPRGRAYFSAGIKNRYSSERRVTVSVATDSGELEDTREIVIGPGQTAVYEFEGTVTDFDTTRIILQVADSDTGSVYHVTGLPVIRPTEPDIFARRYRGLDRMKFETDIAFIGGADLRRASVGLTVRNRETGRRVFRRTYRGFTSYQPEFELSTKDWAPGGYEAHFVFSAPGMQRYETTVDYYHPELPHWWENRYGYEDVDRDRVPYPWTPMEVKEGVIGVWGRQYDFSSGFLPRQVTALDYPMLREPMSIKLVTACGEEIDTAQAESKTEWTQLKRTRVEGSSRIDGRKLALSNDFWAEYDGLVWNRLTIEPKEKIDIVSMEFRMPLTREFTDVINPRDYSMRTTGVLEPEGFSCEPTRAVWLGNAEGGIQWFCETSGWFFTRDMQNALRVEVDDGQAALRVVMIDIPTDFREPHTIEFGFIATPVRPKVWRTPEYPGYRNYPSGMGMFWDFNYQVVPGAPNNMSGLYVGTHVTNPAQEAYKLFADEWRPDARSRAGVETDRLDESNWLPVAMASDSLRNYYAWRHWTRQHEHHRGFSGLYYDCSGAIPSANPYVGTGYRRRDGSLATTYPYLAERDITKRLYVIAMQDSEFASRDAWIGYHHSGMPNMAYMSFANANWDAENLNSVINQQQQTYLGVIGPAEYRAEFMGHNFGWPVRFLGQGRIRREWVDANGGPEAVFDQLFGLALLHDAEGWTAMGVCCILPGDVTRQLQLRRQQDIRELGYHHWKYRFTPYWKQDIVELPGEDMYASFYVARPSVLTATNPAEYNHRGRVFRAYFDRHLPAWIQSRNNHGIELARGELEKMKDKAIMIVYNDTGWEGEMRLRIDWKKLGLGSPQELTAVNYLHRTGFRVEETVDEEGNTVENPVFFERNEEYARIEGEEVVFPMTGHNYRMIVIEQVNQ